MTIARFAILFLAVAVGCGGSASTTPNERDASVGTGVDIALTAADTDAALVCNTLSQTVAPVVTIMTAAQAAPTPAGGSVADGTYYATAATVYLGPSGTSGSTGETLQSVYVLSGTALQGVGSVAGMLVSVSGTVAFSGTNFNVTDTCPDEKTSMNPYTATGNTFTLFIPLSTETLGVVYTKQ